MDEISERRPGGSAAASAANGARRGRHALRAARAGQPTIRLAGSSAPVPRGLFPRSLLIIVMPVVLLQLTVTIIFFERHYQRSRGGFLRRVAGDIAMVLSLYEANPSPETIAAAASGPSQRPCSSTSPSSPADSCRRPCRADFFDVLDSIIDDQLSAWTSADPIGSIRSSRSSFVDIRVRARSAASCASWSGAAQVLTTNWHIFLVWMVLQLHPHPSVRRRVPAQSDSPHCAARTAPPKPLDAAGMCPIFAPPGAIGNARRRACADRYAQPPLASCRPAHRHACGHQPRYAHAAHPHPASARVA